MIKIDLRTAYNRGFKDGYRRGVKEGKEECKVKLFKKMAKIFGRQR